MIFMEKTNIETVDSEGMIYVFIKGGSDGISPSGDRQ